MARVCAPPEEKAFATNACENTLLFVCLFVFVSKATESETNREVLNKVVKTAWPFESLL